MKKRLLLSIIVAMFVFLMTSCLTIAQGVTSLEIEEGTLENVFLVGDTYDFTGVYVTATYMGGNTTTVPVDSSMVYGFDLSTVGSKQAVIAFEDGSCTFTYEVISSWYYTVTFDDYEIQTVKYGETAVQIADPKKEGYDFGGWTLDGKVYDFSTEVKGDVYLTAYFVPTFVTYLEEAKAEMESYVASVDTKMYSNEEVAKLEAAYEAALESLESATSSEDVTAVLETFYSTEVSSYLDKLNDLAASYAEIESEYYADDYAVINEVLSDAIAYVEAYQGGAPIPALVYKQAVKSVTGVVTIEEDAALASYTKIVKLRELDNAYAAIRKEYYTATGLEELVAIYEVAYSAISEAYSRKDVVNAYNDNVGNFANVEKSVYASYVEKVYAYIVTLGVDNYYSDQVEELLEIYYETAASIVECASTTEAIAYVEAAYAAMDEVATIEEMAALMAPYIEAALAEFEEYYEEQLEEFADMISELDEDYADWFYELLADDYAALVEYISGATTISDLETRLENAKEELVDDIWMYYEWFC